MVSRPQFARPVHGVRPPGGVYCHVSGCDLVRGGDGRWRVLEDNVRTPSGISYVIENRLAMTRLMPELFEGQRIRAVDNYPSLLLDALRSVAPGVEAAEATVVLWTPGPMNSAYFEHAFLARQMGIELVEAGDLVVRDAVCYMRTTSGLQRVHTIYRRLDDDFIDPLEFRPDSLLGVPGLVRAYRAGTVAIANAIGTGVADDKAVYHYVPEMIRFYLSEEPILENVPTYLLTDERLRQHVLERLHELVIKPTSESGGKGVFIGPQASAAQREHQARLIDRAARAFHRAGARPPLDGPHRGRRRAGSRRATSICARSPCSARRSGSSPADLPASRSAPGSMIVNSSQGGGSKDTWVLDDGASVDLAPGTLPAQRPPRLPDVRYGGWHGQSQQQQQQRRRRQAPPTHLNARPDRPRAVLAGPRPDPGRAHRAHARRRLSRRHRRRARRTQHLAQLGRGADDHRRQAADAGRGRARGGGQRRRRGRSAGPRPRGCSRSTPTARRRSSRAWPAPGSAGASCAT